MSSVYSSRSSKWSVWHGACLPVSAHWSRLTASHSSTIPSTMPITLTSSTWDITPVMPNPQHRLQHQHRHLTVRNLLFFYKIYQLMGSLDGLTTVKSTNPEFIFTKLNVVIHIYSTLEKIKSQNLLKICRFRICVEHVNHGFYWCQNLNKCDYEIMYCKIEFFSANLTLQIFLTCAFVKLQTVTHFC